MGAAFDLDKGGRGQGRVFFGHPQAAEWKNLYCKFVKLNKEINTFSPDASSTAKLLWKTSEVKARGVAYFDPTSEQKIVARDAVRQELWNRHLQHAALALTEALQWKEVGFSSAGEAEFERVPLFSPTRRVNCARQMLQRLRWRELLLFFLSCAERWACPSRPCKLLQRSRCLGACSRRKRLRKKV